MRSDIALIVDLPADIAPDDLPHATFSFRFPRVGPTEEPEYGFFWPVVWVVRC